MLVKASEAEKNFLARKEVFLISVQISPYHTYLNWQASIAAQQAASEKGLLKNEETRLYIGNLHINLTENDLQQVLEPFGEVFFNAFTIKIVK
jgi:RNA recognition motif-containing protein